MGLNLPNFLNGTIVRNNRPEAKNLLSGAMEAYQVGQSHRQNMLSKEHETKAQALKNAILEKYGMPIEEQKLKKSTMENEILGTHGMREAELNNKIREQQQHELMIKNFIEGKTGLQGRQLENQLKQSKLNSEKYEPERQRQALVKQIMENKVYGQHGEPEARLKNNQTRSQIDLNRYNTMLKEEEVIKSQMDNQLNMMDAGERHKMETELKRIEVEKGKLENKALRFKPEQEQQKLIEQKIRNKALEILPEQERERFKHQVLENENLSEKTKSQKIDNLIQETYGMKEKELSNLLKDSEIKLNEQKASTENQYAPSDLKKKLDEFDAYTGGDPNSPKATFARQVLKIAEPLSMEAKEQIEKHIPKDARGPVLNTLKPGAETDWYKRMADEQKIAQTMQGSLKDIVRFKELLVENPEIWKSVPYLLDKREDVSSENLVNWLARRNLSPKNQKQKEVLDEMNKISNKIVRDQEIISRAGGRNKFINRNYTKV